MKKEATLQKVVARGKVVVVVVAALSEVEDPGEGNAPCSYCSSLACPVNPPWQCCHLLLMPLFHAAVSEWNGHPCPIPMPAFTWGLWGWNPYPCWTCHPEEWRNHSSWDQ